MKALLITTGDSNAYANFLNTDIDVIAQKLNGMGIGIARGNDLVAGTYSKQIGESISQCDILFIAIQENPKMYADVAKTLVQGLGLNLVREPRAADAVAGCANSRRELISLEYIDDFSNIPQSAVLLQNFSGYVQSYMISSKRQLIFVVPIRPTDILDLLTGKMIEYLREFVARNLQIQEPVQLTPATVSCIIKAAELGERSVADMLSHMLGGKNPTVSYEYDGADYTIRLTAHDEGTATAQELIQACTDKLRIVLNGCVYAYDDRGFNHVAGELLRSHALTMATAEHGTRGIFTESILEYAEIDKIFKENSVFVGSDRLTALSIPAGVVSKYGLISKEVAVSMAFSALKKANTSLGVSLLLGAGHTEAQRLCFVVLADSEKVWVKLLSSSDGDSNRLRQIGAMHAFNMLRLYCDSYGHTMPGGESIDTVLKKSVIKALSSAEIIR